MCGIYGATTREQYITLQKLNRNRGDFSQGCMYIKPDKGFEIHKIPKKLMAEYAPPKRKKFDHYLGHSQAPTSGKRVFDPNTTHPFMVENWVVAHNGVLTNFKKLVNEFERPYENPVDSSIIPYIFYKLQDSFNNEIDVIVKGLEYLEGTFGLWIHNTETGSTFLAKCGVTLFADVYDNAFSSVCHNSLESLEEGTLYQLTKEGITGVATFDCDSPFFTV